ncbi:hypothetical protein [Leucobacter sp. OH1287]|uniref:hypothetical protein n=1 Tax=Leucobacter sp. OH1287 TaxID=2491049 RepID=UPI000F603571|nr:hypothetical protein [Leucobacter sp. OH1287]RRD61801.1 hypothetical protein EII30_00360 [Leucobacter sp. OH1287]
MNQHQPSRLAQLGRGAVVSVLATLLAAHSHSGADGFTPSLFAIVVCAAVAWPICVVFAGKRRSLAATTIAVGATQGLFHWVFSAVGPVSLASGPHHGAALTGAGSGEVLNGGVLSGQGADPLTTALASSHAESHAAMLAAHVFAAILTIFLLRNVDAALEALSSVVSFLAAILLPLRLTVTPPARAPRTVLAAVTGFKKIQLLTLPALRGPPLLSA